MTNNEEIIIINLQKFPIQKLMRLISRPFNSYEFFIIIIILYSKNILTNQNIVSLLAGEFIVLLLKIYFARDRPFKKNNKINKYTNSSYNDPLLNMYSFPSGHTFTSTILSLILLEKYSNNSLIKIFPILVAISRCHLGVHYPSDVIFGYIFGYMFYHIFIKN